MLVLVWSKAQKVPGSLSCKAGLPERESLLHNTPVPGKCVSGLLILKLSLGLLHCTH